MWGVARLGARASLFPSCYRASGFARPSLAIASSFDGRVITPARTYCQLEVAPDNQETKLTAIPSNFSQLRYDPPPQQRLWELLHMKDITTEELYEYVFQIASPLRSLLTPLASFLFFSLIQNYPTKETFAICSKRTF